MPDAITCPMCLTSVVLDRDQAKALCVECHDMSDSELAAELQKRVDRAVWTALRAVEDQASYGRWAGLHGKPVPHDAAASQQSADLLRNLLKRPA